MTMLGLFTTEVVSAHSAWLRTSLRRASRMVERVRWDERVDGRIEPELKRLYVRERESGALSDRRLRRYEMFTRAA